MKLEFKYEHAVINRVVDGDTLEVSIDVGFNFNTKQKLRLARINAPEKKTQEGVLAKEFVRLNFEKKPCRFTSKKNDEHIRYIAEVYLKDEDGTEFNLNDFLVEKGYAVYQEY